MDSRYIDMDMDMKWATRIALDSAMDGFWIIFIQIKLLINFDYSELAEPSS